MRFRNCKIHANVKVHSVVAAVAVFLCTGIGISSYASASSSVIQWTTGTGADNNYYQRIDLHSATPLTYAAAQADAAAMSLTVGSSTLPGHLAILSPNYSSAFTFVQTNVMYGSSGSGAPPSSEIYWVGASSPTGNSTPNDSGNSDWRWVDGTSVPDSIVSGWNIDHAEGGGAEGIGYFQSGSGQLWDYIATSSNNLAYGYVVEYSPVPEPASLSLLAVGSVALLRRRGSRNHGG